MTTKEKFEMALDIYADVDAIRDSQHMENVKDFLYEAIAKNDAEKPKNNAAYVVMSYVDGRPAMMIGVFSAFENAMNVLQHEVADYIDDLREAEDYEVIEIMDKALMEARDYTLEDFEKNDGFFTTDKGDSLNGVYMYDITEVPMDEAIPDFDFI